MGCACASATLGTVCACAGIILWGTTMSRRMKCKMKEKETEKDTNKKKEKRDDEKEKSMLMK